MYKKRSKTVAKGKRGKPETVVEEQQGDSADLPPTAAPPSSQPLNPSPGITNIRYVTRHTNLSIRAYVRAPMKLRSAIRNVPGISCQSSTPEKPRVELAKKNNHIAKTNQTLNTVPPSENDQAHVLKSSATSSVLVNSRLKRTLIAKEKLVREKDDCVSRTSGLEFTKIAERVIKGDLNEVASVLDPSLVTVRGYRVKEDVAPLLKSIISKYGDICEDCYAENPKMRSTLVGEVCSIYQRLEEKDLISITTSEISNLFKEVSDLEKFRLNVGWLSERLENISKAKQVVKGYAEMKDKKRKILEGDETNCKTLEILKERSDLVAKELDDVLAQAARKRKEMEDLQDDILFCERTKEEAKAKLENVDENIADAKAKMHMFGKTLVRNLLPSNGWIEESS